MKPTNIIVFALILVACIVAALLTSDIFTTEPEKADQTGPAALFEPAPGRITAVSIQGAAREIALTRQDDKWRITQPFNAPADTFAVDQLVDTVKDIKGTKAGEVSNATTGLATPKWTVTLTDEKGGQFKLLVGLPRPLQPEQTYVRIADKGEVYVVVENLAERLGKGASEFRDMTVLDLPAADVTRVKIAGTESFELVKRDGQWQLAAPVAAPASQDDVRKVVDALARVSATDFVADAADDLAPYGLTAPRLLAEIQTAPEPVAPPTTAPAQTQPTTKPGKVYQLALGKQIGDKIYAKLSTSPAVFRVDQSLLKTLQPKLPSLRTRTVLDLDTNAVTGVDISVPAGKAGLAKVEGKWKMILPRKGPASSAAMGRLLTDAAALKAESFRDDLSNPALYGLDSPQAQLTFRMAGKNRGASLRIGRKSPSGEMTFVQAEGADSVAVVRTSDLTALLAEPATYWDETVLKLSAGARAASLEIRRPDDTYSLVHDANDTWRLTAPLATPANTDQVNKILDSLEDLKAEKIVFVGENIPEEYTKGNDIMQVVLTATEPRPTTQPATAPATKPATVPADDANEPLVRTCKLTFTQIGLHCYAWQSGVKTTIIGQFPLSLYNDLSGELRGRNFWSFKPAKIAKLKIASTREKIELKREGGNWIYTQDPYVKIDTQKVRNFVNDIGKIQADKYVTNSTPKDLKAYGLDKPILIIELTDESGRTSRLTVSNTGTTTDKDRYALASTSPGVMSLPASAMATLSRTLKDFRQ